MAPIIFHHDVSAMWIFIKHTLLWLVLNSVLGLIAALLSAAAVAPDQIGPYICFHQLLFQGISLPTAAAGYAVFFRLPGLGGRSLSMAILVVNAVCLPIALICSAGIGFFMEAQAQLFAFVPRLPVSWPLAFAMVSALITPIITSVATALIYLQRKLTPAANTRHSETAEQPEAHNLFESTRKQPTVFTFKSDEDRRVLPFDEIDYLEARGHRTIVHARTGVWVAAGNLGQHSGALPVGQFQRIHKSIIVNLKRISHIQYFLGGSYLAFLRDEEQSCLRVGRNYVAELKQALGITRD
ncbi:MAG: LytTR family transcriptional regulator DNA-binding domain-containing protein [Leptospiraceae bacterium]|nr:LytTR family transcriptional regulator DNA-binding domain-containing protein [Leptospiraceae bacterium]